MQDNRDYGFHIFLRGIILLGLSMLTFKLLITGNIYNFIAPRMMPFVYFSMAIFFLLGIIQIWRSTSKNQGELYCNCGFDHGQNGSPLQSLIIYSLFVIPVMTGFLFSETILGSSVAGNRGVKYGSHLYAKPPNPNTSDQIEGNSRQIVTENTNIPKDDVGKSDDQPSGFMEDDEGAEDDLFQKDKIVVTDDEYTYIMNAIDTNIDDFIGKEIEISGFVYREPDFTDDQFVVARFGMSCCVADASVFGMIATVENANELEDDEWIKVSGILSKTTYNDWEMPYIQIKKIDKIPQPDQPYIYEDY
ncbi:TIGR03943 family protein [Pueribacillus theae]|uniref:TIGR03943 family protein n=1 Tax=Pueribacillus theae TaxID=2171751 RepID=A0A2U1JSI3_9BACI|nr:TIGR03943 family protein [Pueribacillus theae]PWA08166.1 TIGR03943 family protein [Pueribacillus theae]